MNLFLTKHKDIANILETKVVADKKTLTTTEETILTSFCNFKKNILIRSGVLIPLSPLFFVIKKLS